MAKALRAGLAIASMMAINACSMLERYQIYEPKEPTRVPVAEVAELSVRFEPIVRFMSRPETSGSDGSWGNRFEITLPDQPRITDRYLFARRWGGLYGDYERNPVVSRDADWQSGIVSLTFSYKCPAECPKTISLTLDDLARVNDQASGGGVRQFDRTARTKYQFSVSGEVM